jgi:CheY-like chemotaxis protein
MAKKILYVNNPQTHYRCEVDFLNNAGFECVIVGTRSDAHKLLDRDIFSGVFIGSLRIASGEGVEPSREFGQCGNGVELVRAVQDKGLPLIVLTGASQDTIRSLKDLGVNEVLLKPCMPKDYIAAAKRVF